MYGYDNETADSPSFHTSTNSYVHTYITTAAATSRRNKETAGTAKEPKGNGNGKRQTSSDMYTQCKTNFERERFVTRL